MVTTTKLEESLTKLEQGIQNLLESGDWKKYLKTQSKFHNYSFRNILLILQQYPEASRIAGYNTWKKLSRNVRKGEKGIQILAPIRYKKTDDENESYILSGFKCVHVFDVGQTEGEELPSIETSIQGDDKGLIDLLVKFSENNGVPVYFQGALNAKGYCQFSEGKPVKIVVDDALSPAHRAKTLAHELAHSILHSKEQYEGHLSRSEAELEAESVAYIVMNHFDLDTSDYSFAYIADWQNGSDAIANLQKCGSRIQKAAQQIIDFLVQK